MQELKGNSQVPYENELEAELRDFPVSRSLRGKRTSTNGLMLSRRTRVTSSLQIEDRTRL
jgi:hypothetical protein